MSPTIHILTGSTGAGKSSYAIELTKRLGGVRFSIDEWMTTLFWMDSPQPIAFEWTMERIARCESMIRHQVEALTVIGISSILDLGFTRADHRARFAEHALSIGARVHLHWLDIPTEVRWSRVQRRNQEKGTTFSMDVDRSMFEFMEDQWQAPNNKEMVAMNGERIG